MSGPIQSAGVSFPAVPGADGSSPPSVPGLHAPDDPPAMASGTSDDVAPALVLVPVSTLTDPRTIPEYHDGRTCEYPMFDPDSPESFPYNHPPCGKHATMQANLGRWYCPAHHNMLPGVERVRVPAWVNPATPRPSRVSDETPLDNIGSRPTRPIRLPHPRRRR